MWHRGDGPRRWREHADDVREERLVTERLVVIGQSYVGLPLA